MRLIFLLCVVAIGSCIGNNKTLKGHRVTHGAWLDIYIDKEYAGRIEIGLFGRTVPMTVHNFVTLATRPKGEGYKGSKFHMIREHYIAAGDWVTGDGSTGKSSFDMDYFDDENFVIKHYGAGWVSSYGTPKDRQSSLFMIILEPLPIFDGQFVVFGKVLKGMNVVRKISRLPVTANEAPTRTVLIGDCGAKLIDPPFITPATNATN